MLTEREQPEGGRTTITARAGPLSRRQAVGGAPNCGCGMAFSPAGSMSWSIRRAIRWSLPWGWWEFATCCLASGHIRWPMPPPRHSIIFGISQSGRLIQTMLLHGLHVDEAGAQIFDGAFVHVAGGGKGGFDYRFAMPTRHFSVLEDHIFPTDYFPFTTTSERDPVTGDEASVLDRARQLGAVPKLFYVNNSSEYWNRSASLIGTDPEGQHVGPSTRGAHSYLIAGAQHYVTKQRDRGIFSNCVNPLNHYRVLRALLLALHRWVGDIQNLRRVTTRTSTTGRRFRLPPIRGHSPTFPASRCQPPIFVRRASTWVHGSRRNTSPTLCRLSQARRSRRWCQDPAQTASIREA